MASLNSDVLRTDPGVIALGSSAEDALASARNDPEGPACQASLAAFRTALTFKTIFTSLTAVLVAVTLGALVFVLVRALADGTWDATNSLAVIAGVVTCAGAALVKNLGSKQQDVLDAAMKDVGTYCGTDIQRQLT